MKRKIIRQPFISLDTSYQLSLFGEGGKATTAAVEERPRRAMGKVQFIAPDPKEIRINQARLDEHLKQEGQTAPLK